MARDLRAQKSGYCDRNKFYKRIEGTNEFEKEPFGVFYSKDEVAMSTNVQRIGAKIKDKRSEVVIRTNDCVAGLEVDDRVLYGGEFFRVERIVADDDAVNKEKSNRPKFETLITLVK